MYAKVILLVLPCLLGLACSKPKPAAKAVVPLKTADVRIVDDLAAASLLKASNIPDVESVTTISTEGTAELYVVGRAGADGPKLQADIEEFLKSIRKSLPPDCVVAPVQLLPEDSGAPDVANEDSETLQVVLDRAKAVSVGLTPAQVAAIVNTSRGQQPTTQMVQALGDMVLPVKTPQGKDLHLRDIAEVKIVKAPKRLVHRLPS